MSRITWEVVVLSYKRRRPLGAIIEQHPTQLTNISSSTTMPPVLGRANSYRFVTPKGDEVSRVRRGTPQLDSLGDEYLTGQQVCFAISGSLLRLLTPFGIDLRSGQ